MNLSLDMLREQAENLQELSQKMLDSVDNYRKHEDKGFNATFVRFPNVGSRRRTFGGWKMLLHKRQKSMCVIDGQGYKTRRWEEGIQTVEAPEGTFDLIHGKDKDAREMAMLMLDGLAKEKYGE